MIPRDPSNAPVPAAPSAPARGEAGMTLVELLVGLMLFGVVTASAWQLFEGQTEGFDRGHSRLNALQNLRYAAGTLGQDLQTAGTNVTGDQPLLVYAGPETVAFNADYATNEPNDPFASFYEPDAPDDMVTALTAARQITLPRTSFAYPDVDYQDGSTNSPAETIVFFFAPDSATDRTDDWALYRQVNDAEPELVARHLLKDGGADFFSYRRLQEIGGVLRLVPVSSGDLPLAHTADRHLSGTDQGSAALVDSIRTVSVQMTAYSTLSDGGDRRERSISRTVRLPNMGIEKKDVCGSRPILNANFQATKQQLAPGDSGIELTWDPATDETQGERDVIRYLLWRKEPSESDYGDVYRSFPANGSSSYAYVDVDVENGQPYDYQLAAQDCTPLRSNTEENTGIQVP